MWVTLIKEESALEVEAERKRALEMLSAELVDLTDSYHYDRLGKTHTSAGEITRTLSFVQYSCAGLQSCFNLASFLSCFFKMRGV